MKAKQGELSGTSGNVLSTRMNPPFVVLQIEDNADDRELFQMAAEQAKLPICWQTANSAKAAIAHLQNLLSVAGAGGHVTWPDLVLLDFLMPVESGVSVLRFIQSQARLKNVPVVVLTGSEDQAITEQACAFGARAVMLKPSNFESLIELIGTIYRTYRPREYQPSAPVEYQSTRLWTRGATPSVSW